MRVRRRRWRRRRLRGGDRAGTGRNAEDRAGLPTYADALEEMATRSLGAVTSTSRASRYRVYLHLDTDGAWVNGGHAIPLRLLSRFITDGKVQPVWENRRPTSLRRPVDADPARPHQTSDHRPRPRLPVPRLPHHQLRRDPPPQRVGRRRTHRRTQPDQPLHRPPRRHRPRRPHHHRRPHPTRRPTRHQPVRPTHPTTPTRDTAPPPGGDPPSPPTPTTHPSGGPIRWTDIELPPDTDLPARCPSGNPSPPNRKPNSTPASPKNGTSRSPPTATPSSAATTDTAGPWWHPTPAR